MAQRRPRNNAEWIGNIILAVVSGLLYLVVEIAKIIFEAIRDYIKDERERSALIKQEKEHQEEVARLDRIIKQREEQAIDRLRHLLFNTENKLYYSIEKTEFPAEGRIREYVNFYTYNKDIVAIENANHLVNNVLNHNLCVYSGKSKKLNGSIILEDYQCDMKDITNCLEKRLGVEGISPVMY